MLQYYSVVGPQKETVMGKSDARSALIRLESSWREHYSFVILQVDQYEL